MTSTTRRNAGPLAAIAVIAVVAILAVVAAMSGVFSTKAASSASSEESTTPETGATDDGVKANRFVISYKKDSEAAKALSQVKADGQNVIDSLPPEMKDAINAAAEEVSVTVEKVSAHALGMASVKLSGGLTTEQMNSFIKTLGAAEGVEAVEKDFVVDTMDENVPNDTYFGRQWDMTSGSYGINATNAWSQSRGQGVTVAVIDTGILQHPDIQSQLLPGYDFISDPYTAGDNDGRDSNPADEGDFTSDHECRLGSHGHPSSWHGTHVAGTIAAISNNGEGVSGVAPDAKIVPVRALGHCGGHASDIIDSITWASGGQVLGVPDNANPAKIINMSLGSIQTCPAFYQRTIDDAVSRGAIIVAAAGNEADDAVNAAPASCNNIITVASSTNTGERAIYSNYGALVEVSAPGGYWEGDSLDGGILSLTDTSETTPQGFTYTYAMGTSQATPHVAGTLALMLSLDPTLDVTRATKILQSTSTAMTCDQDSCGTGIINTASAVAEVAKEQGISPAPSPAPPVETTPPADPAPAPAPEPTKRSIKKRLDDLIHKLKEKKGEHDK